MFWVKCRNALDSNNIIYVNLDECAMAVPFPDYIRIHNYGSASTKLEVRPMVDTEDVIEWWEELVFSR